jgi:hypothetical protein
MCLVSMSAGRAVHHVGIWTSLDSGLVLHSRDGVGVRAQSIVSLRASSLQNLRYYRYVSDLTD